MREMHVPESRSMERRHALPLSATYSVRWSWEVAMPYGQENLAMWSAPSRNPREPPPATVLTAPAPSPSRPRALLSTGDQRWGSVLAWTAAKASPPRLQRCTPREGYV